MRRSLVAVLVATVASVAAPVAGPAVAAVAAPSVEAPGGQATSTVTDLAGGGDGLSGPASRARIRGPVVADGAGDGTVLVSDRSTLMRLDPATDRLTVVPYPPDTTSWGWGDVATDGSSVVMRLDNGLVRLAQDGTVTYSWSNSLPAAVDVGTDHVIWTIVSRRVWRIGADGATVPVTAVNALVEPSDLTVSPDGSKVYVLDSGQNHQGVYAVSASGLGARVAGNGTAVGDFKAGPSSLQVSTADVRSISTNGISLAMSAPDRAVLAAPVGGGALTQVSGAACTGSVTYVGVDLAVGCQGPEGFSMRRFTAAGVDRGRVLGMDALRPWSPDGVEATDAYLGVVRGSAGTPDGRVVFTTEHGLVREVRPDGTLTTRAQLPALAAGRGKVSLGADGTAYVTSGTQGLTKVTVDGTVSSVPVDGVVSDVEVLGDGSIVVADQQNHRLLELSGGGAPSLLTDDIGAPADLGLNGQDLVVADGGVRSVNIGTGAVTTVLHGGQPTAVTATSDGPWADLGGSLGSSGGVQVVSPDGSMQPVAAVGGTTAQLQAVGDGTVLRAGGDTVSRILTAGLGAGRAREAGHRNRRARAASRSSGKDWGSRGRSSPSAARLLPAIAGTASSCPGRPATG